MFRKLALATILSLPTTLLAANCDMPTEHPDSTQFCEGGSCIIKWGNYGWWTNFHWNLRSGYFEDIVFDPRNVSVDADRLVLKVRTSTVYDPQPNQLTSAEAVLVSENGNPINIGYGEYLVTIESPKPIGKIDPAVVFGAFTYERVEGHRDPNSNDKKELDMIELSKWGWTGVPPCNVPAEMTGFVCSGIAQSAVQPWGIKGNLMRFDIPKRYEDTRVLTAYMNWKKDKVIYKIFNGAITDTKTAASKDGDIYNWTYTDTAFIPSPDNSCIRFHLNFYRVWNTPQAENIQLEPKGEQTMYVTNFEYKPG